MHRPSGRFALIAQRGERELMTGQEIAEKLGNGLHYDGPQYSGEQFVYLFTDVAASGTTFGARSLEDAREKLIGKRKAFGLEPPVFPPSSSGLRRRDEIIRLRETGLSYAKIGSIFGITRERVRQIVKGKSTPKPDLDSKVMLTITDVGQLLGLHISTVRRWDNSGILRAYHIGPRGDRRFKREDVDRFLREAKDQD